MVMIPKLFRNTKTFCRKDFKFPQAGSVICLKLPLIEAVLLVSVFAFTEIHIGSVHFVFAHSRAAYVLQNSASPKIVVLYLASYLI